MQHAVQVLNVVPPLLLSVHSGEAPAGQPLARLQPFDQPVLVIPDIQRHEHEDKHHTFIHVHVNNELVLSL